MTNKLTIIQPDDWHLHLRDGDMLRTVLPFSAKVFRRAIVMPNLVPPITTVEQCRDYRARILEVAADFEPLMTLYLNERMPTQVIKEAAQCSFIHGVKLYPRGVTTHSDAGIAQVDTIYYLLEAMELYDLPLLVHGESLDPALDVFDRERYFIEQSLVPIRKDFPELRIVFEHVTTREAAHYVQESDARTAATITPHHLLYTRNALFDGGIRPHHYCLPLPQREAHRAALIEAACSGDEHFFLGTDSAPHARHDKESSCGCAGVFNAPVALGVYAQIFDKNKKLEQLEKFASRNGPRFYKLPVNKNSISLIKKETAVADSIGEQEIVPLLAGATVSWRISDE